MDLIRLDPSALSIPLRFGGIVEGSEMLEIDGRTLKRNADYAIDYEAGVIFLRRTPKQGSSLRAAYRYDASKKQSDANRSSLTGFAGPGGMKLNIAQGTSFIMGMGMAERTADGTVLSSNLYGLNNNMKMFNGAGKLKGLFVVSERNKVQSESLWEEEKAKDQSVEDGDSQALVQGLETNFLGGKILSNVQDIREKFNGWAAFSDAGYDGKSIDELKRERGLKRYDYALQDVGVKNFKLRQGFREVSDGNGAIQWRNYGATIGPLSFDWQAQKVDPTFTRFNDLREADRQWLGKEAGMDRQQLVASLNLGSTKGAFSSQKIESQDGSGISRRSASLERPGFRASYSDQAVEREFNRFGNLRDADAGQLGKESGLNRQSFSIEASPLKNQKPLSYAESMVRSETGDFKSIDGGIGLFGIRLDLGVRRADPGFANLGSLSDAEINGHVASMTRFYDVNPFQVRPDERNFFLQGAGIERLFQRVEWNPAKAYAFSYDTLQVKENDDSIGVRTYRVQTPFLRANYREQDTGLAVDEWGKLLEYERQRLGTIAGLDKRNTDVAIDLPKGQGLNFSSMTAKAPVGDATRITGNIKTKPLEFSYQRRAVDPEFENANQLADPEKDRLHQLRGWDEVDWAARLLVLPGLRIDAHWQDAQNMGNDQQRVLRNTTVTYQPDKKSEILLHRYRQRNDDPNRLEADYQVDRLAVCRQFDRWGTFRYVEEKKRFQGESLTNQPNAETKGWSYETQLLRGTAFKTEKAETKFENGDKETITAHTLSAEITKNAGVSVTDLQIQREGEGRMDETKRNYGFWLDLAKGVRLSYGYVRNMTEGKPGEMQQTTTITPGTVGSVKIDAASYQHNQWDERRYQSNGALRVGTAKPISIGDVKDFQFSFGTDSQRDNWNWTKENRDFNGGFKIYGIGLGFAWRSQFHIPSGLRAIDRVWTLSTDQSPNSKLAASIYYKERSMPIGDDATVRNFNIIARPIRGLEIQHQLSTNPEEVRNDVILGSITKADRSSKWQVNFTGQKNIRFGLSWEELKNDMTNAMTRFGAINVTLFADSPSPLHLFYGLEHIDTTGNVQQTQHRYGIRFDQRPGPKQLFSFYASNLNYQYSRPDDKKIQNWTVRLEYQLKF
ncbi:MAG: hypothetical protein HONBIEJF_00650 [Fimbriimonadaceae bacterium]|nr:hypothetical protein [Fimbriimonadaceae bacterium]